LTALPLEDDPECSSVSTPHAPRRSGDPTEDLSGRLVAGLVDFLLVAVLSFGALALVSPGPKATSQWATLAVGFVALLGLRRLARTGRVRAAALALCVIAWLAIAMDLPVHGPNTIAVGGFVIVVVIGGLTLGPVAALALAAATGVLLAGVMLGLLPAGETIPTDGVRLTHYATQLTLASLLVAWWAAHTRRLVRQVRASEARHSQLLEESPDAIVSVDTAGLITFWNRAAENMFGYTRSEIVGRDWSALGATAPKQIDVVHVDITSVTERGSAVVRDLELSHRDGRLVTVEAKSMPLREEGEVVGTVSIVRDLSERKRTELERASLREQLVGAQRMEAVGRFAGGIAHDFNNILTIILNTAEIVRARTPDGDAEAISDISDAATRGAALTRQLLTFSRRQPSQPRPTDVNQTLVAVRPMLDRLLGHDVLLEMHLCTETATVLVDPGQLDQIVVNLVVNARDAMPDGGTITIATELVPGSSSMSSIAIRVTDTGSGMDAATKAMAFAPFFTTKGERGTGLGLSVVQNIVQLAGGTIQCDSEQGRGTTFQIVLPGVKASVSLPPAKRASAGPQVSRKVVLVDDDPLVRSAVTRALRRAGISVDAVSVPVDSADLERRLQGADALITDVVMPGLTGPDLVDELRRRGVRTPVIFVSGHAEHALIERVRGAPNALLLAKPFTTDDILARLDELSPQPAPAAARPPVTGCV
jgi:two-component system cell cycle sensor histidine kinase/response regulator CckA